MTNKDHIAFDLDGSILPMRPAEVRAYVLKMLDEGDVVALILKNAQGEVGVQVLGPPSNELLDILRAATRGYRKALKSAKGH